MKYNAKDDSINNHDNDQNLDFFEAVYGKIDTVDEGTQSDLYFDPNVEALFTENESSLEANSSDLIGSIVSNNGPNDVFSVVGDISGHGVAPTTEVNAVRDECEHCRALSRLIGKDVSPDIPSLIRLLIRNHKKFLLMRGALFAAFERANVHNVLSNPQLSRPLLRKEYTALAQALEDLSPNQRELKSKQTQTRVSLAPDSSQWKILAPSNTKWSSKRNFRDISTDTADLTLNYMAQASLLPFLSYSGVGAVLPDYNLLPKSRRSAKKIKN